MAEGPGGERKHVATERRRQRAREEGQVSKSADLSSAAMLFAALGCLRWLGPQLFARVANGMADSLSTGVSLAWTFQDAVQRLIACAGLLAFALLPMLSVMFIGGIVVNLSQTGWLFTATAVQPKRQNISPLAGFKRIVSIRGGVRLGFGIFKIAFICLVTYWAVKSRWDVLLSLGAEPVPVLAKNLVEHLFEICLWIAAALLGLGLVDYLFQRWRHEQDLKMTDQEIREELKESQGDPQRLAQRKQVQRQLATQRQSIDIAQADAVITSPTGVAVAISYRPEQMVAPVMLAKGAGPLAQQIRQLALAHDVPLVERQPLAQFLYQTVDVGGTLPAEQYRPVAEVLRYAYQLTGQPNPGQPSPTTHR